ncbi:MAG: HNH endonuclease [Verrucomicrobia bacterium]|nr:HNH endonuclease [Verrucomicrobiota bacterium]
MKTYLLVWNPNKDERFTQTSFEQTSNTLAGGRYQQSWSAGNRKKMEKGSRVFLVRLAKAPKGIVAAGRTVSIPSSAPHFDHSKRIAGEMGLKVQCEFDKIVSPEVYSPLLVETLHEVGLSEFNWTPQCSGIEIPVKVAERLEQLWSKHLAGIATSHAKSIDDESSALEGAETTALRVHRQREASLREAKITETKRRGNYRLKCEVPGCGFDFEAVYGEVGQDYTQVHHLKPLGDRTAPSQTKLDDLAVVCANCHAMIHRGGKCRPLNGLIQAR